MKKLLKSIFNKNSESIFTVGFVNKSELETNIPITNLLEENKEFIWKCALNFPKLKFEKINFRKNGDERYINIDEDTKLFFAFWVSCGSGSEEWWKHVSSTDICLVYKDKPIVTIKCHTPQGQKQIMIEYSDVILPFIDGQKQICGQFGAGYNGRELSVNDIDFYYRKNSFISSDDLFIIVKSFINILNLLYNDNKHILESSMNYEMKDKNKSKDELMKLNLENINSFLMSEGKNI
jgi:hypothetical protein